MSVNLEALQCWTCTLCTELIFYGLICLCCIIHTLTRGLLIVVSPPSRVLVACITKYKQPVQAATAVLWTCAHFFAQKWQTSLRRLVNEGHCDALMATLFLSRKCFCLHPARAVVAYQTCPSTAVRLVDNLTVETCLAPAGFALGIFLGYGCFTAELCFAVI